MAALNPWIRPEAVNGGPFDAGGLVFLGNRKSRTFMSDRKASEPEAG
ncbi:MAG: hypothetical protein WBQ60_06385 [Asticcacaulis sp.]